MPAPHYVNYFVPHHIYADSTQQRGAVLMYFFHKQKSLISKHYVLMLSVIFVGGGDMILGSPPCAYLGSVTILKTMTGHHSVFLYVFSQQTDKVLCAPPDLSSAELVEPVSVLSKT